MDYVVIEMWRLDVARTVDEAYADGAVRQIAVPIPDLSQVSFDNPVIKQQITCIVSALDMMDGAFSVAFKLNDERILYRNGKLVLEAPPHFNEFIVDFNKACAWGYGHEEILHAIVGTGAGVVGMGTLRDAWYLWNAARERGMNTP